MCKTYILNKNEEIYKYDEWMKNYVSFLKLFYGHKKCSNIYNDPDYTWHTTFYEDLEKFLNAREDKMDLDEKWSYKFDCNSDGIKVIDKNNRWLFTIFSDQFGFSAPNKYRNHPYDVYAEVSDNEEKSLENIADYVYYTRTIGGSFLWPIDGGKGYNKARGGTRNYNSKKPYDHYIEDRVDLTLLEIKKYYEGKDDIILNNYMSDNMDKWLKHFKDFNHYVDFFIFNSFVDKDYNPKSLFGNNWDNDDGKNWKRIIKNREEDIKLNKEKYKEELERVFENLKEMTRIRSDKIEGNNNESK